MRVFCSIVSVLCMRDFEFVCFELLFFNTIRLLKYPSRSLTDLRASTVSHDVGVGRSLGARLCQELGTKSVKVSVSSSISQALSAEFQKSQKQDDNKILTHIHRKYFIIIKLVK